MPSADGTWQVSETSAVCILNSAFCISARDYSHRAKRRARSIRNLHRQRHDKRATCGKPVERRQVLEGREIRRVQNAMRFEESGLTVIDASCVDANRADTFRDKPLRRVRMQTREMELGHGLSAAVRGAQVLRRIRPPA